MKILFLSGLYPPHTKGGGEVSTHYIARGLRSRGHDVHVITGGKRSSEAMVDGVPVRRLPLPFTAKPLLEQWHSRRLAVGLAEAIDPATFDIIHAHDFRTALALAELGWKNGMATARDYAQVCGTTNNILWDGSRCTCSWSDIWRNHRVVEASWARKPFRIWQYLYNISYRKAAFRALPAQIFISRAQKEEIAAQQDLAGQLTQVIYNPVPESYLNGAPVDPVKGTVLYVGTVEMYKGVGLLIQAWQRVAKDLPNAHLRIVGEGAQRAEYERLVQKLGLQYRVTFSGRVAHDQLRRRYDEAHVVVAPHMWIEPFGRTVAEAMARGRVVVTADAGGPAEMIQDEVNGLLFARGSRKALELRLKEALRLPTLKRLEMQRAARQWVSEHLTVDRIAREHEEFYQRVLAEQRP